MGLFTKKIKVEDVIGIAEELSKIFGENLISVFIHGVGATDEYNPKIHNLQFSLILKSNDIFELNKAQNIISKLKKTNAQISFFMTPEYIYETADVFPHEYLNMQINHKIVWGEDLLDSMQIDLKDLRLQCEKDLRGLLLHLRREFLLHARKPSELIDLWNISLKSFIPIFRSVIFLMEGKRISSPKKVLKAMDLTFHHDHSYCDLMNAPGKGFIKLAFKNYIKSIEEVVNKIDKLNV